MNYQQEHDISCPYCGEMINILIDYSSDIQEYIEDCQVCCRPISLQIQFIGPSAQISVKHENE